MEGQDVAHVYIYNNYLFVLHIYVIFSCTLREVKKHLDGFSPQWGGVSGQVHFSRIFTHGPRRWNHGSTDRLFLLLLLLLLHTINFLFLLGTENSDFQTGLTFQATPVTLWGGTCKLLFSFFFFIPLTAASLLVLC